MTVVLWTLAALLYVQLIWVRVNLKKLKEFTDINWDIVKLANVKLSILIPARNEAHNIEACLTSIAEQSSKMAMPIEILVLDDRSEDGTDAIVKQLAEKYSQVRLISGTEKPDGWAGKNYACHQLSQAATGNWLLFMDADVRLLPDQLFNIIAVASTHESGMLTGFPKQKMGTWVERWVVPMMTFTIAAHLPIQKVSGSQDPRFVAAHGGFILIHKSTYDTAGGHAAIQDQLVDDMQLAKAVKRAGHTVHLRNVTDVVEMRMYHNAKEVIKGYEKNIFAGLGRSSVLALLVSVLYAGLYVLPFACLFIYYGKMPIYTPALVAYAIAWWTRSSVDKVHQVPSGLSLWMPVSAAFLIFLTLLSWFKGVTRKGYTWKGRHYQ